MREVERLCNAIEEELGKIADKGFTTTNIETAYKMIDMYKDIKNSEYFDAKSEYYMTAIDEMQGGEYSERGYSRDGGMGSGNYSNRRDSRGRYSREGGNDSGYGQGSSYANRGKHYVRGHYSRADGRDPYDDYMMDKQSYRTGGKSEDCKKRMLEALEEHMEMLTQELGDMSKDADCREEREMISRYIDKLRNMM